MKTNKIMALGAVALIAGPMLTSCGNDEPTINRTLNYSLYNLVTSEDDDDAVSTVSKGDYSLLFDDFNGTIAIAGSNLQIPGNAAASFTTQPTTYNVTQSGDVSILACRPADTNLNGNAGKVDDIKVAIYDNLEIEKDTFVPGFPAASVSPALVLNYEVADRYEVTSFLPMCYWRGSTTTTFTDMTGQQGNFQTETIVYRMSLDIANRKAAVVIYRGKFAQQAPEISAMVLQDMELQFTHGGYRIVGTNVVPQVVDGDGLTPNNRYVFNSFLLETTNDLLTECRMKFDVATSFHGEFQGSYILK